MTVRHVIFKLRITSDCWVSSSLGIKQCHHIQRQLLCLYFLPTQVVETTMPHVTLVTPLGLKHDPKLKGPHFRTKTDFTFSALDKRKCNLRHP